MFLEIPILIPVLGPTGVGKTRISLLLAEIFSTEIISCDARQFYRDLCIGTSSPDKIILTNIQHHFIGHLSFWTSYNAGDYKKDAFKKLYELFTRLPIVLMVGGSGLYGKVITYGIDYLPFISKEISRDFYLKMTLQEKLKKKDPIYNEIKGSYKRDLNSFHRKITIDHFFNIIKIGLNLPRNILYESINQRVVSMIECGFLEEAQKCYSYRHLNALQTIGYKDIFNYFDGKISFDKAIEEIKKNTRRYAKRQLTWYKKEKKLQWFITYYDNEIIENIKKKLAYIKDKMS